MEVNQVYQGDFLVDPWQVIIDTHGPAHEDKSSDIIQTARDIIPLVNFNQAMMNTVRIQKVFEVTWSLDINMAEYDDWLHCSMRMIDCIG